MTWCFSRGGGRVETKGTTKRTTHIESNGKQNNSFNQTVNQPLYYTAIIIRAQVRHSTSSQSDDEHLSQGSLRQRSSRLARCQFCVEGTKYDSCKFSSKHNNYRKVQNTNKKRKLV